MNGGWFWWWGGSRSAENYAGFRAMWRHMHDYFTNQRGLDNLIWVWSPNHPYDEWKVDTLQWYPGDEYVDIVAMDKYGAAEDDIELENPYGPVGYEWFVQNHGAVNGVNVNPGSKPFMLAEFGPRRSSGAPIPEPFDMRRMINAIATRYPKTRGVMNWESVWGLYHS